MIFENNHGITSNCNFNEDNSQVHLWLQWVFPYMLESKLGALVTFLDTSSRPLWPENGNVQVPVLRTLKTKLISHFHTKTSST